MVKSKNNAVTAKIKNSFNELQRPIVALGS